MTNAPTSIWTDPATEDRLLGGLLTCTSRTRWQLISRLGDRPGFTDDARHAAYKAICVASRGTAPSIDDNQVRLAIIDAGIHTGPEQEDLQAWLMRLMEEAPALDSEHLAAADAVITLADKRATRDYLSDMIRQLGQPGVSVDEVRNSVIADLMTLCRPDENTFPTLMDLTEQATEHVEASWAHKGEPEHSTGSADLDRTIDGFNPGQTLVIAARPSIGKTAVALDMARSLVRQGLGVMFFSAEMSPLELWMRVASAESSFNLRDAARGGDEHVLEQMLLTMHSRAEGWADLLKITDGGGMPLTVGRIEAEVWRQKSVWEAQGITPAAFIVDYVQNIYPETHQRNASEVDRVTEYSRRLSRLARFTKMGFVELSQLRRPDTARRVEEPTMEMLRSSGQLEQDADVVVLLHRPEFYDPEERAGEIDYLIGKSRHTDGQGKRITRSHRLGYYQIFDRTTRTAPDDAWDNAAAGDNPDDWK